MAVTLHVGDCREVLASLDADSLDACVTDPPYELAFMGKRWDGTGVAFDPATWAAVRRVLKPGAHLVAFGGTRTAHRMVCAIEDAGFEIRDGIEWLYGTGFPKSITPGPGLGTALKPAHEPICLARKPLGGTVAATLAQHGTGALNVEACRVGTGKRVPGSLSDEASPIYGAYGPRKMLDGQDPDVGRWPPNVLLTHAEGCVLVGEKRVRTNDPGTTHTTRPGWGLTAERRNKGHSDADGRETIEAWQCVEGCPAREMDKQSGDDCGASGGHIRPHHAGMGFHGGNGSERVLLHDKGGASRFFPTFRYEPKASREERDAGLAHLPRRSGHEAVGRREGTAALNSPRTGAGAQSVRGVRNHHPTVKPVALMRWLVKLVTPPGGTVLDPFAGSGTTGVAAVLEARGFVGVEMEPEYVPIIEGRIAHAAPLFARVDVRRAEAAR